MNRRQFLAGAAAGGVISTFDWLKYFRAHGVPGTKKELRIAEAAAAALTEPQYLIYWFVEGGWDGYSMFNPVQTGNDAAGTYPAGSLSPSPSWSDRIYRPVGINPSSSVQKSGNITYGPLAAQGVPLFGDMAVVSSHQGNQFHSGGRWDYHYGKYASYAPLSAARGPDERTVMQAFCEAYGASYVLPHISWHRWLADGELSLTDYPVGTGYYENLGPAYAHTLYGGTPADMRARLSQIQALTANGRDARIRSFVDNLHQNFLKDKQGATVQAFASAVQTHNALVGQALPSVNPATMFADAQLRADFNVTAADEQTLAVSVNGNPARSKGSPNTNVQAMMAYELMTKGLSCGFFLESRDVRGFDSHYGRAGVLNNHGQVNQTARMNANVWAPMNTLATKLKAAVHPVTGKSYWAHTTIVLVSEMGRMMNADAADILAGKTNAQSDADKYAAVMDQDVCQHWFVSSAAFIGGKVNGNNQFGKASWPLVTLPSGAGTKTIGAIPMLPSGALDPAFDPVTGMLKAGMNPDPTGFISDAGHVYSTALYLSGLNPDTLRAAGKGRNNRPPMTFIQKP